MYRFSPRAKPLTDVPDEKSLSLTLRVASAFLWAPHSLAALYVATTRDPFDFSSFLFLLAFSLVAVALTLYTAAYKDCGDYLLILSWVLGVLSEGSWLTSSPNTLNLFHPTEWESEAAPLTHATFGEDGSRLLWVLVSMLHGAIGGLLCKAKDMEEGRYVPSHAIGERLYVVVPFCTGQWLRFILKYGWRGIVIENMTILLSLAMVGYCMILYKLLRNHTSLAGGDLIGLISDILTTSFGVVFTVIILGNVFVTSLAIPFLKSLFSLNALVGSVGIVFELLVYEVA